MAKQKRQPSVTPLSLGDRVKIRHYDGGIGRIVELRGPLGPGGVAIYRVMVGRKPRPTYIELREDQLEVVPAKKPATIVP